MEGIERVHELLEQLAEAVTDIWGKKDGLTTKAYITVEDDGYRNLQVERWEENHSMPVEVWRRRMLFSQHKINAEDEWSEDESDRPNDYYKRHIVLLKEDA